MQDFHVLHTITRNRSYFDRYRVHLCKTLAAHRYKPVGPRYHGFIRILTRPSLQDRPKWDASGFRPFFRSFTTVPLFLFFRGCASRIRGSMPGIVSKILSFLCRPSLLSVDLVLAIIFVGRHFFALPFGLGAPSGIPFWNNTYGSCFSDSVRTNADKLGSAHFRFSTKASL